MYSESRRERGRHPVTECSVDFLNEDYKKRRALIDKL